MKNIWILILITAIQAQAQWSDNPAQNTVVNSANGVKYVPKVVVTPEGNYFFSWYGGPQNLDMNLAYFDHNGVEIWPGGAIKVSTHSQNSWVDDYTLLSDHEGNAIVIFSDVRNGNKDVVVYKMDGEGNQLWGDDGIVFSVMDSDEFEPNGVVTSNNDVVVMASTNYSNGANNVIHAYKIEANGDLSWGTEGRLFSGLENYTMPRGIANDDNGFSICFYKESGSFPALTRHIAMIKCDENGEEVWAEPAIATEAGGISAWDKLNCKPDGNNGAWFVWSDDRYSDMTNESYVQWINSDGEVMWEENGLLLSEESGYLQFNPMISGSNNSNELLVFWNKVNGNQSQAALMLQKINTNGELQNGTNGQTILPLNDRLQYGLLATQMGDSTYYCYNFLKQGSSYLNDVHFIGLDKDGEMLWNVVEITNSESEKMHATMAPWHSNQAVVCWTDEQLGNNRIMAQNVFTDGALGSSPVMVEETERKGKNFFVGYFQNDNCLRLKELKDSDELLIYNLYGQEVYRKKAENVQYLISGMKGIYIGALIRGGKLLEEYKFNAH